MSVATAEAPRVIHAIPGRVRIHLPAWSGRDERGLEARLSRLPGVERAQANGLTGNVLVRFDPRVTSDQAILSGVRSPEAPHSHRPGKPAIPRSPPPAQTSPSSPPRAPRRLSAHRSRQGQTVRARISVPGMDRNPHVARRVTEHLARQHPSVRTRVNMLTSRILVEFDEHEEDLDDLLAGITGLDLPDVPDEDQPADPLDPGPLVQSTARSLGAAVGLAFVSARRILGVGQLFETAAAAQTTAVAGILSGFPFVRQGLRRLFGRDIADVFLTVPAIVGLALSDSPLGLALSAAEGFRLFTEVIVRRAAWRRFEERLLDTPSPVPGTVIRLETGERVPLTAKVLEGTGTATGRDGLPVRVAPGNIVPAGARLYGGSFALELQAPEPFTPQPRPAPVAPSLYSRYTQVIAPASLAYAALNGAVTRSSGGALEGLLYVNPRTAVIGMEAAEIGASARVLRAGVTIAGARRGRTIHMPHVLLLDGARLLTDGFELAGTVPRDESWDAAELAAHAAAIAAAAGSPWGGAFRAATGATAADGSFDGETATATIGGFRYALGPPADAATLPATERLRYRGGHLLELRGEQEDQPLGYLVLRPRLAQGATDLIKACRRHGVAVGLLSVGDPAAALAVAKRAEIPLLPDTDAVEAIRSRQAAGRFVAFTSDSVHAAPAFNASDLAVAVGDVRSHPPARVDLIAPDLTAVAAIVEAGARAEMGTRGSVLLSLASNVFGAIWGLRGRVGLELASRAVYLTSLAAMAWDWLVLRGGERLHIGLAHLADPHPEHWGKRTIESVLRAFHTRETGLTSAEAAERGVAVIATTRRRRLVRALLDQLRSPLTGILAMSAGVSLLLGSISNAVILGVTLGVTVAATVWQERKADQAAEALERLGTPTARILRDGRQVTAPATAVVPGDLLLLATGDRIAADARLIQAQGLEVDEAPLTGESLPVRKAATGETDASHVVLAGTDVTAGSGLAVVIAVGRQTRMGAMTAAVAMDDTEQSPLGMRLARLLRISVPVAIAAGAIVAGPPILQGQALVPQLALGVTIAITAVPEGLPLLAQVGEAAVARRLSSRSALMRRVSAVEALGRVDIACADKTGTLTEGRPALSLAATAEREAALVDLDGPLPDDARRVVLAAALASPHPDAPDAGAHLTDAAILKGAEHLGLGDELRIPRESESPFDPLRGLHVTSVAGRLYIKGAPETLIPRCARLRRGDGAEFPLNETSRDELADRARRLAARGLRILMVAEGESIGPIHDPRELTALGFVGISDPLRSTVPAAVRRCREAGVRVIMLTGDHPATARAIAREAGLLTDESQILTGTEIAELHNGELDERLERAVVIARATPFDKLRIIESLQRCHHVVAMTGDGVNDAPALRLADVGVAMGRAGTEVARQTADVVLVDDDFSTLVESFVEGRSFWRNIRRAVGLLLGGNLGEIGLIVGASALGLASPFTTDQLLVVNMITDILPALAIALQPPEHRRLAGLAREGTAALERSLVDDVLRRAGATALPSLAAYLLALGTSALPQARAVAFSSIVFTQLAQVLDVGRSEGRLTRPIISAVAGSAGLLATALAAPPLRAFLGLALPTPLGWALIGGSALAAVTLGRLFSIPGFNGANARGMRALSRVTQPALQLARQTGQRLLLLPAPAVP